MGVRDELSVPFGTSQRLRNTNVWQNQGLASEVLFWESGSVEKMQGSGAVL